MNKNPLLKQVKTTLKKYKLIKTEDRVLVSVSGGPDSVALLAVLHELMDMFKWDLQVAHINHKLRGKESNKDQEFVYKLASKYGVEFHSVSVDTKKLAKEKKLSLEEAARNIRYEFLGKTADRIKAHKIALGHTQNDQAETVLMRLFRGAGSLGLSGIPIKREKFIRPLLEVTRQEILEYLKEKNLRYRQDKTNLKTDFLRNKIRLNLLPWLNKEVNPEIVATLSRTAMILNETEQFLNKETEKIFKKVAKSTKDKITLDLEKFSFYDKILKRNLIRKCWQKLTADVYPLDYQPVERVLDLIESNKIGKRVNLKNGYWAELNSNQLVIFKKQPIKVNILAKFPGEVRLNGFNLKGQVVERKNLPEKIKNLDEKFAYLDWGKLKAPLKLRFRSAGDRFKPLGMEGTKKVSDFLVDLKVPRYKRDEILLLISGAKIAWIVGHRISEEFKITKQTKKVLALKFSNAK